MKKSSGFIFAFVGILCLMLDLTITTTILNTTVTIDIINDSVGYLMILFGMIILRKSTKYFRITAVISIIGFITSFFFYTIYSSAIAYLILNTTVALINIALIYTMCLGIEKASIMNDDINMKNRVMIQRFIYGISQLLYIIMLIIVSLTPQNLFISFLLFLFTGIGFATLCLFETELIKSAFKFKSVLNKMIEENTFD